MPNISHYEALIQEKRKKTPFRDFVREIASWETLSFYKRNDGKISRYHHTDRIKTLGEDFWERAPEHMRSYTSGESFVSQFQDLQDSIPLAYTLSFPHLGNNENCQYSDAVFSAKNVYLSFVVGF